MSKTNSTELLEALHILDPKLLVEEIRSDVVEYFTSEDLRTFVGKLFEEDKPMLKIAKFHCDSFAMLYSKCKQPKNLFIGFQLRWHSYCSALLLHKYAYSAWKRYITNGLVVRDNHVIIVR